MGASRQVTALIVAFSATTASGVDLVWPETAAWVAMDDECELGSDCALNALQFLATRSSSPPVIVPAPDAAEYKVLTLPEGWTADMDFPETWNPRVAGGDDRGSNRDDSLEDALSVKMEANAQSQSGCQYHSRPSSCFLFRDCVYGHHAVNGTRYCVYGNYMIVPAFGISGTEGINHDNSQDVDLLMHAAYDHCNSTSCVLMVNPMHHRTQNQLHLHFRHYNGGGAHLKRQIEELACNNSNYTTEWHHFHKCKDGKVKAYSHFPNVFSEVVEAYGNHSLANKGITVFPSACGDKNMTLVLGTGHCSIEHSITR